MEKKKATTARAAKSKTTKAATAKSTAAKAVAKRPRKPKSTNMDIPTIEERDKLIKLYCTKALPVDEIAEKLGWSVRTLFNRLQQHGIARGRDGSRKKSKEAAYCPTCHRMWSASEQKAAARRLKH